MYIESVRTKIYIQKIQEVSQIFWTNHIQQPKKDSEDLNTKYIPVLSHLTRHDKSEYKALECRGG